MAVAMGERPLNPTPPRSSSLLGGIGGQPGVLLKILALIALDVVAAVVITGVYDAGEWGLATFITVAVVIGNLLYLHPRAHGYKFLFPGVVLLALFIIWPAIYTVFISSTNYGTGHILSQEQAVDQVLATSIAIDPDAGRLPLTITERADGSLAWLLQDADGTYYYGDMAGATPIDAAEVVTDDAGRVTAVGGDRALSLLDLTRVQDEVLAMEVPLEDGRVLTTVNGQQAVVRAPTLEYDEATNTFTSTVDGTEYTAVEGTWRSPEGRALTPGYRANIGWGNYDELLSDPAVRGAFLRIFLWNVAFAFLSVAGALFFGMFIALVLNHKTMKGIKVYRSLLIIPYAIPSFVTALVWRGMFRAGDGIFARMLPDFLEFNWFGDPWLAKLAIIIVNVWLGFPYFFVVSLAFLQTLPGELTEAAKVDGATPRQIFRRITWPLLFVAMTPLLISSFAFNFNNFNTVELVTSGDPVIRGTADAGHTDILITFAFNLATNSAEGSRFAFSATVSVLIFILVAAMTTISFARSNAFKSID
jgi:arabinogalactan oligomer/maltooligosaccharide transport system permease protein